MNKGPGEAIRTGVLFYGTGGLALFGLALRRFFSMDYNLWYLVLAIWGLGLFLFCLALKREFQRQMTKEDEK